MDIKSDSYKYIGKCEELLTKLEGLKPEDPDYKKYYIQLEQAIHQGMKT